MHQDITPTKMLKPQFSLATVSTQLPSVSLSVSKGQLSSIKGYKPRTYIEDHLERMHYEIECTTRHLEIERRRLFTLDEALKRARNEFEEKRARMCGRSPRRNCTKLRSVEGSLANAIMKLNHCSARNDEYKMCINRLRMEGKNLDQVSESLRGQIRQSTGQITKYCSVQEELRTEVAECRSKITELKKGRERDRQEFKETAAGLNDDLRLHDQLKKARSNGMFGKSPHDTKQYMVADEEDQFSEQLMYRRILKLAFLNCIQRRHIKQHQKNIEVFEQAFATIKSSTGIGDNQIVAIFDKLGERDFSLLTYVNIVHSEMEAIEVEKRALQAQERDVAQHAEQIRKLSKLEQNVAKITAESRNDETEHQTLCGITTQLMSSIRHICQDLNTLEEKPTAIECSDIPLMLTTIEEIVGFYEKSTLQFKERPREKGPILRVADLPSCNVDSDEDEEQLDTPERDKPLSRQELKTRAEKTIASHRRRRFQNPNDAASHSPARIAQPKDIRTVHKVSSRVEPGSLIRPRPMELHADMENE